MYSYLKGRKRADRFFYKTFLNFR
uniref:Uncharacterized protein n=1 Tax=Heterorhabditis bacteriophora TaxID=37862 RepID=A0A1I7WHZ6_HETBA